MSACVLGGTLTTLQTLAKTTRLLRDPIRPGFSLCVFEGPGLATTKTKSKECDAKPYHQRANSEESGELVASVGSRLACAKQAGKHVIRLTGRVAGANFGGGWEMIPGELPNEDNYRRSDF